MSDVGEVVTNLYDKLILRDFLAKVLPGIIVMLAIYIAWFSTELSPAITIMHLSQASVGLWVIVVGLGWFAGMAVQSSGEVIKAIRPFSRKTTTPDFFRKLVAVQNSIPRLRQGYERYVIIKEACGNASMSLFVAVIFVTLRAWYGQPLYAGWLALVAILAAAALLRMHWVNLERQREWTMAALAWQPEGSHS